MKLLENPGLVLVIRMRNVPVIDATGIRVLREVHSAIEKKGTKLILAEVNSNQVINELKKARLVFQIGKGNILETFERALTRANEILLQKTHLTTFLSAPCNVPPTLIYDLGESKPIRILPIDLMINQYHHDRTSHRTKCQL
jgi:anti-anti-sigma regulatory factor